MKNFTLILAMVLGGLSLTSCKKNELSLTERRLVGAWEFEKAKHHETGTFKGDNITDEYAGSHIEFRSDKTTVFYHQGNTYEGRWEMSRVMGIDGTQTETISASLYDPNANETYLLTWDGVSIFNNTLWTTTFYHQNSYRYKLKRI